MRFNATLSVDFAQWKNVKMERENSMRDANRPMEEEMPKFGAGSEYHRDLKEELRRKKFGFQPRKFKQGIKMLKVRERERAKFFRIFPRVTFFLHIGYVTDLKLSNFFFSLSKRCPTMDIESWWKIWKKIPWCS